MAKKTQSRTSLHLGPEARKILERRKPDSVSGQFNQAIIRYDAAMSLVRPEFTRAEWCALLDANNGGTFPGEDDPASIRMMLWANVADSPGLGEKWGIDQEALVRRLRGLSLIEAMAVGDAADVFWRHAERDTDEALQLAGCRIVQEA